MEILALLCFIVVGVVKFVLRLLACFHLLLLLFREGLFVGVVVDGIAIIVNEVS